MFRGGHSDFRAEERSRVWGPQSGWTCPNGRPRIEGHLHDLDWDFMDGQQRQELVVLGEHEITLISVGLDIGSATTQLLFSRVHLVLKDARYLTVGREILHISPVMLTPYVDATTLDAQALYAFVKEQYQAANLVPDEVDTGVLIMTGTALRPENAKAVGSALSLEGGRLVSLAAGDAMEATIAAHGSGAVQLSQSGGPILNVDIGGGTTKLSICEAGRVVQVAALDVGARLIAWDEDLRIIRLEPQAKALAKRLDISLSLGAKIDEKSLHLIAESMAAAVLSAAGAGVDSQLVEFLLRTPPLDFRRTPGRASLSGGVSCYFGGQLARDFGDLGSLIAAELKGLAASVGYEIHSSADGIRATVLGASQHTVQMSGATVCVSGHTLPIRNVRVADPIVEFGLADIDSDVVATAVSRSLMRVGRAEGEAPVAIRVGWSGLPTFARLDALSRGIVAGLEPVLRHGHPAVVVTDVDIGRLLGNHLIRVTNGAVPVICVDGVELRELDFVDLGSIVAGTTTLPVTIKSIIFEQNEKGR